VFWTVSHLLFSYKIERVTVSSIAALICVWLVWRYWPAPKSEKSEAEKASEPGFGSRIAFCSVIASSIGFAGGVLGPMIFAPKENLGPLLGIITGPLGFLLGPAIGVASLIPKITLQTLRKACYWLMVQSFLGCILYKIDYAFSIAGIGLMAITFAVGTALFIRTLSSLKIPRPVFYYGLILLVGSLLMLLISLFPPIIAPWWGNSEIPHKGQLPSFSFILNPGFSRSHHVPLYAIDMFKWKIEILITIVVTGIAASLVKLITMNLIKRG
jgi:hypothetical protein